MDQNQINKNYSLFNIPADRVPHYENPSQLAGVYKKCSLYEYVPITYSASSSAGNLIVKEKE